MKKITLILTIIVSIKNIQAQKYLDTISNFKIENNTMIWQKVFTRAQFDRLQDHLITNEFTKPLTLTDSIFTGRTATAKNNFTKTPTWAKYDFNAFCKLEYRSNRYRATCSQIKFNGPTVELFGVHSKMDFDLTEMATKNAKIKNQKRIIATLKQLNAFFTSKFTISDKKNNTW